MASGPQHVETGDAGDDVPSDVASGDVSPGGHAALDVLLKRTSSQQRGGRSQLASLLADRPRAFGVAAVSLLVVALGSLGWHFLARAAPIEERMAVAGSAEPVAGNSSTDVDGDVDARGDESGNGPAEMLVVHVAGAVKVPGLVELAPGARVADALAGAGGLGAGADQGRLNLAAPVMDGARLYVPLVGEQVPSELGVRLPDSASGGGSLDGGPVDINSADSTRLESLPGVGPATAEAIIEHRDRHGVFESLDGLLEVRGIGEAKLEALAEHATVG